jgi:hypothetical protein
MNLVGFFFEQEHDLEGPRDFIQITRGGYKLQRGPLASLALRNLEFEERPSRITKNTPETNTGKAIRSLCDSATATGRRHRQDVAAEKLGAYARTPESGEAGTFTCHVTVRG